MPIKSPSKGAKTFQFHKGTIRTSRGNLPDFAFLHFNSIKVQLEHNKILSETFNFFISIP